MARNIPVTLTVEDEHSPQIGPHWGIILLLFPTPFPQTVHVTEQGPQRANPGEFVLIETLLQLMHLGTGGEMAATAVAAAAAAAAVFATPAAFRRGGAGTNSGMGMPGFPNAAPARGPRRGPGLDVIVTLFMIANRCSQEQKIGKRENLMESSSNKKFNFFS